MGSKTQGKTDRKPLMLLSASRMTTALRDSRRSTSALNAARVFFSAVASAQRHNHRFRRISAAELSTCFIVKGRPRMLAAKEWLS